MMVAVAQWQSPRLWFWLLRVRVPSATRLGKLQVPNPKFQAPNLLILPLGFGTWGLGFLDCVPVAQPDRASDFGFRAEVRALETEIRFGNGPSEASAAKPGRDPANQLCGARTTLAATNSVKQ